MSRQAGPRRGGSGGLGGGQSVNSTVSIVVAAVAVILGFFILRDINNDNGGGSADGGTSDTSVISETTLPAGPATTLGQTTGFKVQVVNAAGVSGAAGDLTVALAGIGFIAQPALTKSDATPKQTVTKVYYFAGYEAAAASVAAALGGVETAPMPDPVPSETGNIGEASVMVLLGTDLAGKPLPGAVPTVTAAPVVAETTTTVAG
jgi:LytR cell envelope-related transcriptional attenuator